MTALRFAVVVAAALIAFTGCVESLQSTGILGATPRLPVSACETQLGGCNVLVSAGVGRATEPSVAINPLDSLHVVGGSHATNTPHGDVWPAAHVSRDGGATWETQLLPGYPGDLETSALTGYTVAGDPALAFGPEGSVYYSGIAFHRQLWNVALWVARSDDGGETWPSITFVQRGASSVIFNDKEYITVDRRTGEVYVTWTLFRFLPTTFAGVPVDPLARGEIFFAKSSDQGLTWSAPLLLSESESTQGSIPGATLNGRLHVVFEQWDADTDQPAIMFTTSKDRGASFSPPVPIAAVTDLPSPLPNTKFRVNSMPTFGIDLSMRDSQNTLYVAWPDYRNDHADILLIRSTDNGVTWSAPVRVNDDATTTDQFMPWLTVDGRGSVHVLYLDRSEDPENTAYHARVASSTDGGLTFTSQRVSDAPSDDRAARRIDAVTGEESATFIGDYSAIASSNARVVALWPDLRHADADTKLADIFSTVLTTGV